MNTEAYNQTKKVFQNNIWTPLPFITNLCNILGFMIRLYFIAREELDKQFAARELFYVA